MGHRCLSKYSCRVFSSVLLKRKWWMHEGIYMQVGSKSFQNVYYLHF